jgi:hypothetical protein
MRLVRLAVRGEIVYHVSSQVNHSVLCIDLICAHHTRSDDIIVECDKQADCLLFSVCSQPCLAGSISGIAGCLRMAETRSRETLGI